MIKKFTVSGMTCSACSLGIEKKLNSLDGINSASVSLMLKELKVDFDDSIISEAEIINSVEKLGYSIFEQDKADTVKFSQSNALKKRFLFSLIFLIPLMYFSMGGMIGLPVFESKINLVIQFVLATTIIILNFKFYTNGVKAVINKAPNMDTLVSLGSFSAYVYSIIVTIITFISGNSSHAFFEASAMVLTLVTLGKWLEELSKLKTGDAIEKLSKLIPKTATVIKDGKMVTVFTNQIEVGDTVVLRVGDYACVDGVVVEGQASIDKSAITGESIPEEINVDDFISSGSIIKDGFLLVEAIQVGEDTLFSKIIEIVKTSGASKAPIQRMADKVAGVFVPIVTSIALIVFAVWAIFTGDIYLSLNYAINVLVISCPCSLGLATPVAVMASMGSGASKGILFKDAGALQNARKIDCVLLDKTATLTVGKPKVLEFKNFSNLEDKDIYLIASALETMSSHPLAECIIDFCGKATKKVDDYNYVIGNGIIGNVDGRKYYMGNVKLLPNIISEQAREIEKNYIGQTVLFLSSEEKLLAIFAISDYLKESSKEAVLLVKSKNIKTVMITGDNLSVAKRVADEVGIDDYVAEVLPQDKFEIVNKYKSLGYNVAMVGDGINDSPALSCADVGIAMGTGTDIAIDSSDIIIANGNLKGINEAIELSKKSTKIIKENLFWAFFYNVIAIPLAGGALSFIGVAFTPMVASVCMSLSSLFVVGNALRIRKEKKKVKASEKKDKNAKVITTKIVIEGMMCGHCSSKVNDVLSKIDSVIDVVVDLKNKTATITSYAIIADDLLNEVISKAGYRILDVSTIE